MKVTIRSGKFELYVGADRQYYFRLKAPNGEIIAASEGYTTKQSAETGIAAVRKYAAAAALDDKT